MSTQRILGSSFKSFPTTKAKLKEKNSSMRKLGGKKDLINTQQI